MTNPVVAGEVEELDTLLADGAGAALGVTRAELEAESDEPTAVTQPEPTEPIASAQPPATDADLTNLPAFRKYQAKRDQNEAALLKRLQALEEQVGAQAKAQEARVLEALEAQLEQAETPEQRRTLIRQMANYQAQSEVKAWQQWTNHVARRVTEEGLAVTDFDPMKYNGEAGAVQFERDVLAAKAKKLETELRALRADPEKAARAKLAQLAEAKGYTQTDLGGGVAGNNQAELIAAFNAGRISRQEFLKRMG